MKGQELPFPSGAVYADPLVSMANGELMIHRYYFPWAGSKTVPLARVEQVDEVTLGHASGRWRLWGGTSPRYWLNLDLGRPRKRTGFVVDDGKRVKPVVTPDDPVAFREALAANGVRVTSAAGTLALQLDGVEPPLVDYGNGHLAACHHPLNVSTRAAAAAA